MILYLSSQKFGKETTFLKEWIKKHNKKILLIFNALDAKGKEKIDNNIKEDKSLLEEIGFEVTIIDLKDYSLIRCMIFMHKMLQTMRQKTRQTPQVQKTILQNHFLILII